MKTFVAIVVGQGRNNFVQSLHVAADSYRRAAAIVLRAVRNTGNTQDFQIAIRPLEEESLCLRPCILQVSDPVLLNSRFHRTPLD